MADASPATSIIEGTVKFRDGKKWKSRWCVMRKLSPVADCVHLQLYKDLKERQRSGQTKASLSLQQFLGFETGFTLDKESNTLALLCEDVVPVLAFDTREILIQWRVKVQHNLGSSKEFAAVVISAPSGSGLKAGPARLHACGPRLALCASRPPEVLALWDIKLLRRFGMVDKRFCVEGGSRCGRGEGLFVFAAERGRELAELLTVHSHDAHARLSLASRSGSALDKRFSDTSSCLEECFQQSLRSASPAWGAAAAWGAPPSHTAPCLAELDAFDDDKPRRPASLPRCASCVGRMSHLTRSSTMHAAGALLSPVWTMEHAAERRSDGDRASVYSRSSGSASEYSVPAPRCTPAVPAKTACRCRPRPEPCCCRNKAFNGPYENYDVPKTPMPLIQEHPADASSAAASLYDTPKKLKCLLQQCDCSTNEAKNDESQTLDDSTRDPGAGGDPHANYVNVAPPPGRPHIDLSNYANIDRATLDEFESSLRILRSAGFSQEELDALEDIPEHDDDACSAAADAAHRAAACCPDHADDARAEPLESSLSSASKNYSDNVSRISHLSDPTQHSDADNTLSTRRSSSADFTRRRDDEYGFGGDVCFTPTGIRRTCKSDHINEGAPASRAAPAALDSKSVLDSPEPKAESGFVAKFKDVVKIRRSSSVPSKSDKNRDSSSSNDSGVSTGSLKHHRGDFNEFETPIASCKSSKKHKSKPFRNTLTPVHGPFAKSNSSDPMKNLTFQFEEVSAMTKSASCDVDTLTRRKKNNGDGDAAARHSQMTTQSSSGASDTSDYMESLSVSSLSSCDAAERHVARPRSGNEYASIDRAALAAAPARRR